MYWDTYAFLYDQEAHLFYRDKGYFNRKTPSGQKTFWARGNGWVMAGIARVLQYMPKNHPTYSRYEGLLQTMAASVKKIQNADGLWRPSLLDESEVPHPETSGSAFFCYAMAWGINNGSPQKVRISSGRTKSLARPQPLCRSRRQAPLGTTHRRRPRQSNHGRHPGIRQRSLPPRRQRDL